MNDSVTLAKDKIGGCRYVVTVRGNLLTVTMRGYGLKATDSQKITRKGDEFNYDAAALTTKMVALERRMRDLARLTTQLTENNHLTGVARLSEASVSRPAKGVNPLSKIRV
ncbi:MAG: hypothetical protein ACOYB3_01190 [Azonexus sp.]